MATFPALTPTASDFTAPVFPVRSNVSLSGVTSRRLFGSAPARALLRLTFSNIQDSTALTILEAWNEARGPVDPLTVPSEVLGGTDLDLRAYMLAGGGTALVWHFTEDPPQLQRVKRGISTVQVALEATIDA